MAETAYNVAQALDNVQKARLMAMLKKDMEPAVISIKPKKTNPNTSVADYKEWVAAHYALAANRSRINNKPGMETPGFNHS